MQPQRILFTGGRSPATLALLRLFGQEGHHCYVAESLQPNLAGHSRFCSGNFTVPPPRQEPQAFVSGLKEILKREKIDWLIPTCEESFYVSRFQRELQAEGCQVFSASSDLMTHLHSKYQFNQLLRTLKLPAPLSERLESPEALKAQLSEWQHYVLKPEFSRFASRVLIHNGTKPPPTWESIHPSPQEPWVLQEFLEGPQFCSYSVARNGKLQAHAVYPTRYAMGAGATIYFESVDLPEIQKTVETLVSSLDYSGQISFDFIQHDGHYYAIECNPRTTTGTFLFALEDHLPQAFLTAQNFTLLPSSHRPIALTLPMLFYALPQHLKSLPSFLRDLMQARDPLLELEDFSPSLAQFGMLWKTLILARRNQMSMLAASTLDIEWNGFWN